MKKLNYKSFSSNAIVLVVVIMVVAGGVGWYVYSKNQNQTKASSTPVSSTNTNSTTDIATSSDTKGQVTFDDGQIIFTGLNNIDEKEKQQILDKFARPIVFYETKIIKNDLVKVEVSANKNYVGTDDYKYQLAYFYKDSAPKGLVRLFGANKLIGYWNPQLCDDDSCEAYPTALKDKYPNNYKVYVECKTAEMTKNTSKIKALSCDNP